jgi:hypothetical protein
MRKFFAGILLVQVFLCLYPKAQTTDPVRASLNTVFQHIDKSKIPTGYLEEYGPGFVPFGIFNGQLTDSNRVNIDLWELLYGSFIASKIYGTQNLPSMETAMNMVSNYSDLKNNLFALPIFLFDYGVLRPQAVNFNLFTISNNQIYDVPGRTQSPYIQKTMFAASPLINGTSTGNVTILLKPDLFFTNTTKVLSTVHIDFNDGSGYMPVLFNVPYTKTYTDTGYKRWKIKITCTDNTIYQCYSEFYVSGITSAPSLTERYSRNPDVLEQPFNNPAAHKGGKLSIWYSKTGVPGC